VRLERPRADAFVSIDGAHSRRGKAFTVAGHSPLLDRLIHESHRNSGAPSLSAAVFRHGTLLHLTCCGNAHPETLYQTASLGKHFTAALALLLAARGDGPALDAPVARHLPELPRAWTGITLRHLLSHAAGIPDAGYDALDLSRDYTDSQLALAVGSGGELEFPPGSARTYSNAGYVLAGIAIGRSAGAFYGDLLRELIFDPLGMATATVNTPAAPVGHIRENSGTGLRSAPFVSPTLNRLADGGISLSILDLARWESALCSPFAAGVAEMFVETKLNNGRPSGYGLGWFLSDSDRGRVAEHDGLWQGFSTAMVRHLDEGLSAVVLADVEDLDAANLAHSLLAAVHLKEI
jgi:CubicO group peptidase (beta-lactamase class C family)